MEFSIRRMFLFSLMLVVLVGAVTVGAFAMPLGNFAIFGHGSDGGRGPDNRTDNTLRSDMMAALDSADYTAYMTALDKQWKTFRAGITQDKFNEMVSRHNAMKNASMNISDNRDMMYGRYGSIGRNDARWNSTNTSVIHDAEVKLQKAIDSGDYNSWKEAVDTLNSDAPSGMPHFINNMTNKITVDNFATYVNFTKALQERDFDTAKQLATTLGIDGYEVPMMPIGESSGYGPGYMHGDGRFGRGQFDHMNPAKWT